MQGSMPQDHQTRWMPNVYYTAQKFAKNITLLILKIKFYWSLFPGIMSSQIPTDVYILLWQLPSTAIPCKYFQIHLHVQGWALTLSNGKALKQVPVEACAKIYGWMSFGPRLRYSINNETIKYIVFLLIQLVCEYESLHKLNIISATKRFFIHFCYT